MSALAALHTSTVRRKMRRINREPRVAVWATQDHCSVIAVTGKSSMKTKYKPFMGTYRESEFTCATKKAGSTGSRAPMALPPGGIMPT